MGTESLELMVFDVITYVHIPTYLPKYLGKFICYRAVQEPYSQSYKYVIAISYVHVTLP